MQVRTRILLTATAAVILIAGALFAWSEIWLKSALIERAADELEHAALAIGVTLGDEPFSDSLADLYGDRTGLRVTFIAPDGTVAGDSEVPADRLPELEDHSTRPEVVQAARGGSGRSIRESASVSRELLYVAVAHPRGAVRVAAPFEDRLAPLVHARRAIIAATLVASLLLLAGRRRLESWILADAARAAADLATMAGDENRIQPQTVDTGPLGELVRTSGTISAGLQERLQRLDRDRDDLVEIFGDLEDAIAVIDSDGFVIRANRSMRRWAGRESLIGERFAGLFRSPEIAEAFRDGTAGKRVSREARLGEHTVLLTAQPHRGGALFVIEDLTRLRQLEGVRRDFVANVSHELKTPLTSIVGFAEAMTEGDLTGDQEEEFGERILSNAMRMRRLVDDLLDLALFEAGGWSPDRRTVDVAEVAKEVWESLSSTSERRDVGLRIEDETIPAAAADPEGVRQIFRNLFENALRYAPDESDVRLGTESGAAMLRVEVSDSGPGIPTAHTPRIFERFYRVDPARSRAAGGTGLGLSIVKHLVAAHGGDVGADSEVGQGTTIWFTLPLSETADAETPDPEADTLR